MTQRAVVAVVLLAASGLTAGAQRSSELMPVGDRDANEQLSTIVESTRQSGLPVEPILSKVRYAVVVAHAAPARIVDAARKTASRLVVARDALAPGATPADIIAGEDALGNRATKEALQTIRAASGNQPVAVPLGVLAQLVASGVPANKAAETVVALIKRGASTQQLAALGNEVNLDVAGGALAAAALDIRARGLSAVLAPPTAGAAGATVPTSLIGGPKKP